jgi:hypothetical protein
MKHIKNLLLFKRYAEDFDIIKLNGNFKHAETAVLQAPKRKPFITWFQKINT